ncbi:NADH dehydrogenase [ubiquinone] 1 alpha subcomplex subunit 10, mitochondrial-like isoform X1 [Glandiceps talaboti]
MALLVGRFNFWARRSLMVGVLRSSSVGDGCKMAASGTRGLQTSCQALWRYNGLNYLMGERTLKKFNERSKIITIDGNIAVGKTTLGTKLAEKLGMHYIGEPDLHYFDRRDGYGEPLDPKYTCNVTLEKFYNDPKAKDGHTFRLQMVLYVIRFQQYGDALEHILSTGQGVIMDRSVYSDFVFLEAIMKAGLIRNQCYDYYDEIKGISLYRFIPPHLCIYLDAPIDVIQKRIKQRGKPFEQNIENKYLESLDDAYKTKFLPQMSETSEILQYDWTNFGDVENIIEDIDLLKFDKVAWKEHDDVSLHHIRVFVTDKFKVGKCLSIPKFLPELTFDALEFDDIKNEYTDLPGMKYAKGYNERDGSTIFK